MTPRLMVVCLGGLAGAGAVVCCDMDEGVDELPPAADGQGTDAPTAEPDQGAAEADGAAVH